MYRRYKLFFIVLLLLVNLVACSQKPVVNTQQPEKTQETDSQQVNNPPTNQPTPTAQQPKEPLDPYIFSGSCSDTVKAGEPFYISFSIQNNTDIPIIATTMEFIDFNMAESIIPDEGWGFDKGGLLSYPRIGTSNIFVKSGASIDSQFGLIVMNPGTYQFKIAPSIKVGDWRKLGEYVVSFIVEDTAQAKNARDTKAIIETNKKAIKGIESRIIEIQGDIDLQKNEIEFQNDNIKFYQDNIVYNQDLLKENPSNSETYNDQIAMNNGQKEEANKKIDQAESKIKRDEEELKTLTLQKDSLIEENEKLGN